MKTVTVIEWLVATIIFLAIVATIGNVEVYLESIFPNP
jgi:hypothetical protein